MPAPAPEGLQGAQRTCMQHELPGTVRQGTGRSGLCLAHARAASRQTSEPSACSQPASLLRCHETPWLSMFVVRLSVLV